VLPALPLSPNPSTRTPAPTQQANDFEFLRSMFPQKELQLIKFQIYSLVKKNNKNCGWQTEEDHLLKSIV
jgi:hypothetical protein